MLVQLEVRDRIGYVTLNRPESLNAINQTMMDDLDAVLNAVESDDRVAVLIISGRGRAFCAGSDVKDLAGVSADEAERIVRRAATLCQRFEDIPQPTIAAIEGHALGGGAALALYQDIRVASDTAVFGFPGVMLGWNPPFGMARLTRLVGRGWASDLLLTGRTISAQDAAAIRLIDRVVTPDALMTHAETLAHQIAQNSSAGIRAVKHVMRVEADMPLDETDDYELRVFKHCVGTEEAQDNIRTFGKKRRQ